MHILPVDNATDYEPFVMALQAELAEQGHIVRQDGEGDVFDDVWGSEPSSPTVLPQRDHPATTTTTTTTTVTQETPHHVSDIRRLQTEHTTSGYREGITAGKEKSLQAGFDEGYSLGAAIGSKAGQLLGLLEGIAQALVRHPDAAISREAADAVKDARADLCKDRLFTAEYFNTDGTWKFAVGRGSAAFPPLREGEGANDTRDGGDGENDGAAVDGDGVGDEEGDVVFASVADAHPLIARWTAVVDAATERWGIDAAIFADADDHDDDDDGRHDRHHQHRQVHAEARTSTTAAPPQTKKPLDW